MLVSDDMQTDLKENKLIENFFVRGKHPKIGITQCEQFPQDTKNLEKANTDYIVLIAPFIFHQQHIIRIYQWMQ